MKKIKPFAFQRSAVDRSLKALRSKGLAILSAQAGSGKTVIAGMIAEALLEDYSSDESLMACPAILYLSVGSVLPGTKEKLSAFFNIPKDKIQFASFSALRSKEGELHFSKTKRKDLTEKQEVEESEVRQWCFTWRSKIISPRLVIIDESHNKNRVGSQQSEVCMALTSLAIEDSYVKALFPRKKGTQFLFMSATPFVKAIHAEMELRLLHKVELVEACPAINQKRGRALVSTVTRGIDPCSMSFTGLDRVLKHLDAEEVLIRVPTITTKYKRKQQVTLIPFSHEWQSIAYNKVMEDYERECEALSKSPATKRRILVEMIKRNARAEEIRWPELSAKAHNAVQEGYQVVIACGFQMTIARVIIDLYKKGYRRKDISLIWGGSELFSPFEEKLTDDDRRNLFERAMAGESFTKEELSNAIKQIRQEHKFLSEEDLDILGKMEAGPQHGESKGEVDNFQSGRSKICLHTFKAGSVGIDLNHSSEYYAIRERYTVDRGDEGDFTVFDNQEKRFLTQEELPKPRFSLMTPCLNPVEFVQAMGRPHRINSVSHTIVQILFFRNTIEEHTARILGPKLVNMKAVTQSKEAWADLAVHKAFVGRAVIGGEEEIVSSQEVDASDLDEGIEE